MPGSAEPPFLLGPRRTGLRDPRGRLRACLEHAWQFIHTATADTVLRQVFTRAAHRHTVSQVLTSDVHVGFMVPDDLATLRELGDVIAAAGFHPDGQVSASSVLARELAANAGGRPIPTTIVTLRPVDAHSHASYVELFLPTAGRAQVSHWIEHEVATHVGWLVDGPGCSEPVRAAFAAEGFVVPTCVAATPGQPDQRGVDILYFDRGTGAARTRIELMHPVHDGAHRHGHQPGDALHA